MSYKVTGILSYCSVVGWLVAFFGGDRSCRFHLNQGFVYAMMGLFLSVVGFTLDGVGFWLSWVLWPVKIALIAAEVAVVGLSVLGIISAVQNKEIRLPLGSLFTILR